MSALPLVLKLQATREDVMRAVDALQQYGKKLGIAEAQLFGISLALEESASNVVRHSLGEDRYKTFQVTIRQTDGSLEVELRDAGPPFDPTDYSAPSAALEDSEPAGGWGIELARRHVDEIRYHRAGDENILSLTKRMEVSS